MKSYMWSKDRGGRETSCRRDVDEIQEKDEIDVR